ncbi:putative inorganic phosphate cotransporter [Anticarsia gemmatalis]|uniref:putative inorganic phosphate cotransporter n=1 Tax=Anticarsia gemmatalis TaxID=129554 RepID=UPI003F76DF50
MKTIQNGEKKIDYEYKEVPYKENVEEKPTIPKKYGYGIRHIQLVLFFLSLAVNFISRGHLGVTIVAMTSPHVDKSEILNNTAIYLTRYKGDAAIGVKGNITNETLEAFLHTSEKSHETYDWPKSTQEMVLGSFFVGYCIMMFPTGMICQRWGGKLPLQASLFFSGIASILTPWLTTWGGWKAACGCRILQGLAQAGTYPSIQSLVAKWVAVSERAMMSSYVYIGTTLGTVIGFQLGGFLGASSWGWPSAFYAVGVISLVACALLTVFGAATPMEHKTISEEEKNFILGGTKESVRKPKTPWKAIFTSKPLWGAHATHIASGVSFVFFFNQVPSYIHYILGINVKNSGVLSSLPYVASFFTSLGFGWISDYCTNHNIVTVKNARRISNTIAQLGLAISLVCASYANSAAAAVTCLVVTMACHMGVHTGWMVNHIDLAPNFSGTLMAIGNSLLTGCTVLLPVLVSNVVTDLTNITQWRIIFFIVAGACVFCNFIFVFLMSADTQPWNDMDDETCIEEQVGGAEEKEKR